MNISIYDRQKAFIADLYGVTGIEESGQCLFFYQDDKMIAGVAKFSTKVIDRETGEEIKKEEIKKEK
jgi:hypothetical protein